MTRFAPMCLARRDRVTIEQRLEVKRLWSPTVALWWRGQKTEWHVVRLDRVTIKSRGQARRLEPDRTRKGSCSTECCCQCRCLRSSYSILQIEMSKTSLLLLRKRGQRLGRLRTKSLRPFASGRSFHRKRSHFRCAKVRSGMDVEFVSICVDLCRGCFTIFFFCVELCRNLCFWTDSYGFPLFSCVKLCFSRKFSVFWWFYLLFLCQLVSD